MNSNSMENADAQGNSIFSFFGKNFIKTKCERDSLMFGIIGGITTGIVSFLCTSNPKKSTQIGVGGYAVLTLVYAVYCINEDYKMRKEVTTLRKAMYDANLMTTTEQPLKVPSSALKSI